MLKTKEWFGEWFDSPYYHVLYKHRDDKEAKARQRALDSGVVISPASDAFVADLTAAFAPVKDGWVAAAGAVGVDGAAALDFYVAEQANVAAGN